MIVFRRIAALAVVALVSACTVAAESEAVSSIDADAADSGAPAEAGASPDGTGRADASAEAEHDAGVVPGELLGTLSGSCGIVRTLLDTPNPTFEQNLLAFTGSETYERDALSADAQRMFDTPNAGGTSTESEVMSLEVLRACEGATLLKTETEIDYVNDDAGPPTITDILVEIAGKKVGVSVTRAYKPAKIAFSDADVKALLEKKLEGVLRSSARVAPHDRWTKQILHVFAASTTQAEAVARVLPTISSTIRNDTIVLLTQTSGGGFVYCNPDPPLGSECP